MLFMPASGGQGQPPAISNLSASATPVQDIPLHTNHALTHEMIAQRGVADTLPTLVHGPRAAGWWGIVFLVTIEVVVFTALIISYFYLKSYAPRWPAGGITAPELFLPTLNTVVLIASALPIYWANHAIRRNQRGQFLISLLLAMLMGVIFLWLKYVEYSDKGYNWSENAYASIVWTMTGFHILHVTAVLLKSAAVWVVGAQGYFNARRYVAVEGNALYWYFVIVIWIPLYLTIYISPRVL
jgi:heme/copper-type cytochrome/quinol oxidase subunit 3